MSIIRRTMRTAAAISTWSQTWLRRNSWHVQLAPDCATPGTGVGAITGAATADAAVTAVKSTVLEK
jgi:hypothetical protein